MATVTIVQAGSRATIGEKTSELVIAWMSHPARISSTGRASELARRSGQGNS